MIDDPAARFHESDAMVRFYGRIAFFDLITATLASEASFATAIQEQLAVCPGRSVADEAISYAQTKSAYYQALRAAVPELIIDRTSRPAKNRDRRK